MNSIKDGDVFRWYYKDDIQYRARCPNGTAYWCMDNQCFATIRDGATYLIDTYLARYGCEYLGNETKIVDIDRVDLEFICNLNKIEWINEYNIQDYDKVYNLSRQKHCYKNYAIDKGAQPSNSALIKKYKDQLASAVYDKNDAESRIQWINEELNKLGGESKQ